MPKVQVSERDIVKECVINLMKNQQTKECESILVASLATYAGAMREIAHQLDYEKNTGNELPSIEQIIMEMAIEAIATANAAIDHLGYHK